MAKIAKDVGLKNGWSLYDPIHIRKALDTISEGSKCADTVQIAGKMPIELSMMITSMLYPIVQRLEWGVYNGPRNVIFSYESE